jgi:phosphatidylinositol alpha-1,6-mannosyltransferase
MPTRLLITLAFPPDIGGMQSFAYQRCLHAGANHLVVLAPRAEGWQAFDRRQAVRIHRWSAALRNVPGIKRILQFVFPFLHALRLHRQERFDAIECWQPLPFGLIGLIFKVLYGVPYLVWSHGNDLSRPQRYPLARFFLSRVLAAANLVIANSQSTKGDLLALGTPSDKIRVLNPPVDTNRFRPDIAPFAIVQKHDLEGRRVILTVARLVRVKGIDTVIKAMPMILEAVPNAVYLIVGDGPLQAELEHLAEALGVRDNVIFAGAVGYLSDDLPRYYAACDAFVLVSCPLPQGREVERFGMVYLEAGASGKPVIGTRGGGAAEAIEDGVTGLLVDPEDLDEVTQAIIRVLTDLELAKRLGENAGVRMTSMEEWTSVAETLLREYQ